MNLPKLTSLELQIMEAMWNQGRLSIREIQEAFPAADRPAYTTIQTVVYRLEEKGVVRRVRKIGNAHIFEAVVSRQAARGRLAHQICMVEICPCRMLFSRRACSEMRLIGRSTSINRLGYTVIF